jgi:hypothetical protein
MFMHTENLIFCIACESAALFVKFVIYLGYILE